MPEKVKEVFELMQATSSKLGKEQILRDNMGNRLFGNTLRFLFNPYITTGLSTKKMEKKVCNPQTKSFDTMLDVMKYLKVNKTGTDEIIANVQGFIYGQHQKMHDFYKEIFTKSIKIGCGATTINKVYGQGFIPEFEVQLANKYFECVKKVRGQAFTLTLKLDGIRCLIVKENGDVLLYSRQGQRIEGLVDIENELMSLDDDNFVLDGELLITKTEGLTSKEQYKATTKIVRRDGVKHDVTFRAFDLLSVDEFNTKQSDVDYSTRRYYLEKSFGKCNFVKVLPALYVGTDLKQIDVLLEKVRNDGQEGLMLNINSAPYEFKRTSSLLKVKIMQDCDLKIVGFEEGRGRLSGTLGNVNVDYKGNILGVGSGFNDEQRGYFWSNRDNLLGRVIKVQYFEETQDSNGKLSLRFPVFVELREEGKKVSYS